MKEPTMEEMLELVVFDRGKDGALRVRDVYANVCGSVMGTVWGDVRGDVRSNVWGDVRGTIKGQRWQFVQAEGREE